MESESSFKGSKCQRPRGHLRLIRREGFGWRGREWGWRKGKEGGRGCLSPSLGSSWLFLRLISRLYARDGIPRKFRTSSAGFGPHFAASGMLELPLLIGSDFFSHFFWRLYSICYSGYHDHYLRL